MSKPFLRGDLSTRLVDLTRGEQPYDYYSVRKVTAAFLSIMRSGVLHGNSRDIRGGYRCVCFSEAPIAVLAQMMSDQSSRYAPYGVMLDKTWLFGQGGRPAIYQPEEEFELLPEEIRYRHVRYDPVKGEDYTWEREWRIKTDALRLDPACTTFIVPNRAIIDSLKDGHAESQRYNTWAAPDVAYMSLKAFPWHFIALEDLGVQIDFG